MSGLDVMVSDHDCIIAHVFNHAGEEMLRESIDIVVVICGVVSLETVSSIEKDDIFLADSCPDAVHIP